MTVFQTFSTFPPAYYASLPIGMGLSGILGVGLRALSLTIWPVDEDNQSEERSSVVEC